MLLPAVTGAWGVPGGGALLSTSGSYGFNLAALERPDLLARHSRRPRTINMIQLADGAARRGRSAGEGALRL